MTSRAKILSLVTILLLIANISIGGYTFWDNHWPRAVSTERISTYAEPEGPPYHFDYNWTRHFYIDHAMGGILGDTYTNSYEAFLLNYQLGHRVFEVDFYLTIDDKTVAAHDGRSWAENATFFHNGANTSQSIDFSYDNFMSSLWHGKYHPLDLADVFKLMQKYPDIYVVTDTKFVDEESVRLQFNSLVMAATEIDVTLLDRLIPQIYHEKMLDVIMDVYPWDSVIYTLYQDPTWTPESVLAFSETSGVKLITMPAASVTPEIAELWSTAGIKIAAHTVNNLGEVKYLQSLGVEAIYTDFLLPEL